MTERLMQGLACRFDIATSFLRSVASLPKRIFSWYIGRCAQNSALEKLNYSACDDLIIFFIPGTQVVSGGVLQIFTLFRITKEIFKENDTATAICWNPGEGWDMHHFDGFNNDVTVLRLNQVLNNCRSDCSLTLHIPEYASISILERIGWDKLTKMGQQRRLKINILNQNIERMTSPEQIHAIKKVVPNVTCTVGNPIWASEKERQRLDIPIHVLPTWYYPDDAAWQPYESKKNLMIVSPDRDPNRNLILETVRKANPDLEIKVIQNLKYEQYLELERVAKWSLTFGEGLDGYFYGPVMRGAISFAVRNGTFDIFGIDGLRTVYDSYETMANKICECMQKLDAKEPYEAYNSILRTPLAQVLGFDHTVEALAAYYRGEFDFP